MACSGQDVQSYWRWAAGNLVENRNRGVFAEWLVGRALGAIGTNKYRQEWDSWDLLYGVQESKIEVKAAGRGQAWPQRQPSVPRFDIAPKSRRWDPLSDEWTEINPPARTAEVFVFCLHTPEDATNENVADEEWWEFWVILASELDDELGPQQSVGLATLDRMTERIGWSDIKAAVDKCIQDMRR